MLILLFLSLFWSFLLKLPWCNPPARNSTSFHLTLGLG